MSIARGLVGWWRLDGNLTDASGNGNNGTVGAGSAAYASGVYGQAWDNDETRFVQTPKPTEPSDAFTIAFWIKGPLPPAPTFIRACVLHADSNNHAAFVGQNTTGVNLIGFGAVKSGTQYLTRSTGAIPADSWVFIVGTFNGSSTVNLYVDAVLQTGSFFGSIGAGTASGLFFGRRNDSSATSFIGQIDNAMIFNRALTPSEIKTLYALGSPL